jgi:hypothetical protein
LDCLATHSRSSLFKISYPCALVARPSQPSEASCQKFFCIFRALAMACTSQDENPIGPGSLVVSWSAFPRTADLLFKFLSMRFGNSLPVATVRSEIKHRDTLKTKKKKLGEFGYIQIYSPTFHILERERERSPHSSLTYMGGVVPSAVFPWTKNDLPGSFSLDPACPGQLRPTPPRPPPQSSRRRRRPSRRRRLRDARVQVGYRLPSTAVACAWDLLCLGPRADAGLRSQRTSWIHTYRRTYIHTYIHMYMYMEVIYIRK